MCNFVNTKKKRCNLTSVKIEKRRKMEEKRLKKEARLEEIHQRDLEKMFDKKRKRELKFA